jgi:NADH-quinone oxidoreductase subunit N
LLIALGAVGLVGGRSAPTTAFGGAFIRDPMSDLLKGAVLVVTLLAFRLFQPATCATATVGRRVSTC